MNQDHKPATPDLLDSLENWLAAPAQAYASWLAGQQYAASTKTVYLAMFSRFCRWLEEQGKRLEHCDKSDIGLFLDSVNRDLPESRHRIQQSRQRRQYVIQLERVFSHLGDLGLAGTNPGRQAGFEKLGRGRDQPTRFLTQAERSRVIAALAQQVAELRSGKAGIDAWIAYRDLALIAVILGAGLKISHLARLTLNCIDRVEARIDLSLPRYTHRARIMAFAVEPIAAWLEIQARLHGGALPGTFPVFEADRSAGFGRTAKTLFMHASSIHRRTERFLEAAGIAGERACAQTLRNTYAGMLIDGGASDEELVDFLGLKASVSARRLRETYAQSKASEAVPE